MDGLNPYECFIAGVVKQISEQLADGDRTAEKVTVLLVHRIFPEIIYQGTIPDWVEPLPVNIEYSGPRTGFYDRYDELLPLVKRFLHPNPLT
jgi:hypothetical protein